MQDYVTYSLLCLNAYIIPVLFCHKQTVFFLVFLFWLSHYHVYPLSTSNRCNTNGHSSAHSKYQLLPAVLKQQGN